MKKLVTETQVKELADVMIEAVDELGRKVSITQSGIQGAITPTSLAPVNKGMYPVSESGIYSNFKDSNGQPISITQEDFESGIVFIVFSGTSSAKVITPVPANGEVKEGDQRAVSGEEVYETLTSVYISELRKDVGFFYDANTGSITQTVLTTGYSNVYDVSDKSKKYYATGRHGGNQITALAVYFGANSEFISSEYQSDGTMKTFNDVLLNPPENATIVCVLGDSTVIDVKMLVEDPDYIFAKKSEVKSLKDYTENLLLSTNVNPVISYPKKLYDITTGLLTDATSTDAISVAYDISDKSKQYYLSGYVGITPIVALAVYLDNNNNFISSEYQSTGISQIYDSVELNPPIDAVKVVGFTRSTVIESKMTVDIPEPIYLKKDIFEKEQKIQAINNLDPIDIYSRKYFNALTGLLIDSVSEDGQTLVYNIYDKSKDYYVDGYVGATSTVALAVYFDANDEFISSEIYSVGIAKIYRKKKINPPINAIKLAVFSRELIIKAEVISVEKNSQSMYLTKPDSINSFPQIKNNPLPIKDISHGLKVLCFGSSWFMNTWYYLNKITSDSGVNADLTCFYSGGARFQVWIDAYNNSSSISCWKSQNGADWTSSPENFKTTIESSDWDLIVFQQGARQSRWWDDWENWSEIVSIVKRNCNPRTAIAFNNTWTPAKQSSVEMLPYETTIDGQMKWQDGNNEFCKRFLSLSGIDLVVPNGSLMRLLRDSNLNDIYDLATDGLHPDNGLPMYALNANLFQTLIAPIYGLDIKDSEWLPDTSTQKAQVSGNSWVDINSLQQNQIFEIIKLANSDRF